MLKLSITLLGALVLTACSYEESSYDQSEGSSSYDDFSQDSGEFDERESWEYEETTSSSSNTSNYSSEGSRACCFMGRSYRCPDSETLNLCFRGEYEYCEYDPSIDCAG